MSKSLIYQRCIAVVRQFREQHKSDLLELSHTQSTFYAPNLTFGQTSTRKRPDRPSYRTTSQSNAPHDFSSDATLSQVCLSSSISLRFLSQVGNPPAYQPNSSPSELPSASYAHTNSPHSPPTRWPRTCPFSPKDFLTTEEPRHDVVPSS